MSDGSEQSEPARGSATAPAALDSAPSAVRLGAGKAARYLADALRLTWRAAAAALVAKLVLVLIAGSGPLAVAWLTKLVIDRLTVVQAAGRDDGAVGGLLVLAAVLGTVGVGVAAAPHVTKFVDGVTTRRLRWLVTGQLYTAVNSFAGLAHLENPRFQDRLRLAESAGRIGPGQCVEAGLAIAQGVVTLVGFAGSLLIVAPAMVLVVGLAVLPTVWVEISLSRRRAATAWRLGHVERRELFYAQLLVSLEAAKEIRLFRLGDFFGARLLRELSQINREQHIVDRREVLGQTALALLGAMIAAGGLGWAIMLAARGVFTVGDMTLFIAAVASVQGALQGIVLQVASAHEALLLFDHHQAVVGAPPDLRLPARPAPCAALREGIELRDVWFRYTDDQPWVLRGVNVVIPAGRAVGLVGVNGAGKSTLVKLLCRFYDPVRGSVRWDGTDLRALDLGQLRERLSAVFQDFMGYDLPASENIGIGDVTRLADTGALERAARLAGCHDAIAALPAGYRTLLSRIFFDNADKDEPETGVLLSGGQWQRVAIARALFRDQRDLLILDEPSAGLDAEAEHQIHERLRELRHGRTSLLISHRLSTVRDADVIVVLDGGRVVEQGTHDELMASRGRYARLFNMQARGYQPTASRARSTAESGVSAT